MSRIHNVQLPKMQRITRSWCSWRLVRGFTLIELMVVLLILALLTTIAAPRVTKYLGKAKSQTAQIQVDALSSAVDAFHLDMGRFPSQEESLKVLVEPPVILDAWDGPYIKKRESLIDPWGQPYRYLYPSKRGEFEIYSYGADGKQGGEADARDVANW